jgi:hypothetical protein
MGASEVKIPKPLVETAQASARVIRAVSWHFRRPSEEALEPLNLAVSALRQAEAQARETLPVSGQAEQPWWGLSRAFVDAADYASLAAEESRLFSTSSAECVEMAEILADGAEAGLEIFRHFESPERAEKFLIELKKLALNVERIHRRLRKSALDDPRLPGSLKLRAVAGRLSDCAEALQRFSDLVGSALGAAA